MPNVIDVLRWANRREVAREITRRGYRVSGETLNRWVRERAEVPAVVEHIVFDLFGTGQTGKERPPWADALAQEMLGNVAELIGAVLPAEQEGLAHRLQDALAAQQMRGAAASAQTPPHRDTAPASGGR